MKRKNLIQQLNNVKWDFFISTATDVGFIVTKLSSGSHYAVRKKDIPVEDVRGVITTVFDGMSRQVKIKVVKAFIRAGANEDDIWRGLKLL
mgnify:CR=1 FL=1